MIFGFCVAIFKYQSANKYGYGCIEEYHKKHAELKHKLLNLFSASYTKFCLFK